jgi:hypothetical protein
VTHAERLKQIMESILADMDSVMPQSSNFFDPKWRTEFDKFIILATKRTKRKDGSDILASEKSIASDQSALELMPTFGIAREPLTRLQNAIRSDESFDNDILGLIRLAFWAGLQIGGLKSINPRLIANAKITTNIAADAHRIGGNLDRQQGRQLMESEPNLTYTGCAKKMTLLNGKDESTNRGIIEPDWPKDAAGKRRFRPR